MKSKYRFRRILSGVMAAVTILSTVISPLTVYASEEPKAAEPPAYESVKDQLDENEVVKATDLELEVGQDFDVSTDFTNLEIKDESKVKVTFQKAENDAGENFSTSHADTYHAVYYVEPVNQNHPVYQIGRNLIVKEPVTAAQSEPQTEQAVTEEDTGSDDEEAASQEETETVPVETEIVEPETAESETEEPEETQKTKGRIHVVEAGETLGSISQKYYGDGNGVEKIMNANGLDNPNHIVCGQELLIP